MKKLFNKKYLMEDLFLPYKAIENKIVDLTRWSVIYEIIFEDQGKFWKTYYSRGATELQFESPWEYDEEVECEEVEKKNILVETWVPVE